MKTRVKINSGELVKAILDRQLSSREAAKLIGVGVAHFSQLLQGDRHVSYKLAAKLKAEFGSRAIIITD